MGRLILDEENHWVDWITDAEVPEGGRLEWGMLEHNDIEGFLPFEYVYVDNQLRFRYSYAAMHPITAFFQEKQGGFDDCYVLLTGVLEIIMRGQEYLLDERGYLLKPEWVFWNHHERQVALCYLPGEKNNIAEDFIGFLEFLMKHMDHKNRATVEMVYGFYDVLKTDGLQAEKNLLLIRGFQAGEPFGALGRQQKIFTRGQPKNVRVFEEDMEKIADSAKETVHTGQSYGNRGKFFLKWTEDALTGGIFQKLPEEIRSLVIEEETTIGRSEACTYVLPFLQISRKQAVLSEENGRLYLMDTASCNGTWLNGIRMPSEEKMECLPGDRIRFANITYSVSER